MFKKLIIGLIILLMATSGYAAQWRVVETVASEDSSTAVDVASTTTTWSESFSLKSSLGHSPVGVMYKASSDGIVAVTLQVEQSFQRPTTELLDDVTYVEWEAPTTVNEESWNFITLDTVLGAYGRFKLTGTGSNDASTEFQFKVLKQ